MTLRDTSSNTEPNYQQYVCGGVHCKCMNLDGKCPNFHNGDHTCPASSWPSTTTAPQDSGDGVEALDELIEDAIHMGIMSVGTDGKIDYNEVNRFKPILRAAIELLLLEARTDEITRMEKALERMTLGQYTEARKSQLRHNLQKRGKA